MFRFLLEFKSPRGVTVQAAYVSEKEVGDAWKFLEKLLDERFRTPDVDITIKSSAKFPNGTILIPGANVFELIPDMGTAEAIEFTPPTKLIV